MASGTVTITTLSVDWPNHTRGYCVLTNIVGWNVDANGTISFNSISSTDNMGGIWGVCTTGGGHLIMTAQVNYGGGWQNIASATIPRATCPSLTNAVQASITLIGQLGTAHLTGSCQLRILYYADLSPNPSQLLPNAFPSSSYSEVTQVPVNIELDYRPGKIMDNNGTWQSHNRSGGASNIRTSSSWSEMKTSGAPSGQGNPPTIYHSGWYNQRKIGANA